MREMALFERDGTTIIDNDTKILTRPTGDNT